AVTGRGSTNKIARLSGRNRTSAFRYRDNVAMAIAPIVFVKTHAEGDHPRRVGASSSIRLQPTWLALSVRSRTSFSRAAHKQDMSMTGTVAVAYLARSREGEASFRRFAQSYSQHAAGVAHDLVIIYKAFDTAGARDAARAVFSHVPHIAIDLEDGDFDI